MFDGINPNLRIFGSRFEQARTSVVCTAPMDEDARGHLETVSVSFTRTNISSEKMSQHMEIASNIQPKFFCLNVRHNGLQPSIFVRSFSQITKWINNKRVPSFKSVLACCSTLGISPLQAMASDPTALKAILGEKTTGRTLHFEKRMCRSVDREREKSYKR